MLAITHFNPLIAELNPTGHLLALLGAHHIFHVIRIKVNKEISKTAHSNTYKALKYFNFLFYISHV